MGKLENLASYIEAVANNDTDIATYRKFEQDILEVNADELFDLFYSRLSHENQRDVLVYLDKLMHVFYQSLKHKQVTLTKDSFLDHLHQENNQLSIKLENIKTKLKNNNLIQEKENLHILFDELSQFNVHYLKKENILFPYLEKKHEKFHGVSIMWTLHDQTRQSLNHVLSLLLEKDPNEAQLKKAIGQYFFNAYGLIQKEEAILFVVAQAQCSINEFAHMREQSFEYGFAFIDTPLYYKVDELHTNKDQWLYSTKTGKLTYDQLTLFLDTLPMDCTIVDENDKVIYFNNPTNRFFPRSPAIIGREVVNCHPADSVSTVVEIVDSFKQNKRDSATFWIDFKGRKLLIQYFPMRDENNQYKGVIEVTQDISETIHIKGQKRLLDWD